MRKVLGEVVDRAPGVALVRAKRQPARTPFLGLFPITGFVNRNLADQHSLT
jgi:hypothetical protein